MQQKLGSPFLSDRKRGERCPSVQVGATEARAEARAEDAITARAEELKLRRLELRLELKS